MNLSQTQLDAKQAYLTRQQDEMLAIYQKASENERDAIIKQIDSFLEVISPDAKIFWLKFKRKLEISNEQPMQKVLFLIR